MKPFVEFFREVYAAIRFSAKAIKGAFDPVESIKSTEELISPEIIIFSVNVNVDVGLEYRFRNYSFVKTKGRFSKNSAVEDICLNIEAGIILANRKFFKSQASNIQIRKILTVLNIRDLEIYKHDSNKYAIIDFYLDNLKNEISATTYFHREVHLIDNFKVNVLIKINILDSKEFSLDLSTKTVFIKSCNIIISVNTEPRGKTAN